MVKRRAKVPEWVVAIGLVALLGCGGETQAEEGPDRRAAAALALSQPISSSAAAPDARAAAALAVRAPRDQFQPEALQEPAPRLTPRVTRSAPGETVSEPERAPVVVRAGLDPMSSSSGDSGPTPVEDGTEPPDPLPPADADLALPDPGVASNRPEAERIKDPLPPRGVVLESGLTIPLTLESGLSTRENAIGDPFFASVTDDVLDANGMVLVPLGTRVRGRVVESLPSTGPDRPAKLELVPEALMEGERAYALVGTILSTHTEAAASESTGRTVAKIGVGAAAGAILGKLIGKDTEATVVGAIAGAAAGTAAALSTKDGHAELPEGSAMLVRLDVPILLEPR